MNNNFNITNYKPAQAQNILILNLVKFNNVGLEMDNSIIKDALYTCGGYSLSEQTGAYTFDNGSICEEPGMSLKLYASNEQAQELIISFLDEYIADGDQEAVSLELNGKAYFVTDKDMNLFSTEDIAKSITNA